MCHARQCADFGAVPTVGVDVVQFGVTKAESVGNAVHLAVHVDGKSNPVVTTCKHLVDRFAGAVFHVDGVQDAIMETIHGLCCDVIGQLSHRSDTCSKNGDLVCLRVDETESTI